MPLRRRDECPACSADLHVCRLCEFYDTSVAKSCREPVAEEVTDKERANFCDFFALATDDSGSAAGDDQREGSSGRAAFDDLFNG